MTFHTKTTVHCWHMDFLLERNFGIHKMYWRWSQTLLLVMWYSLLSASKAAYFCPPHYPLIISSLDCMSCYVSTIHKPACTTCVVVRQWSVEAKRKEIMAYQVAERCAICLCTSHQFHRIHSCEPTDWHTRRVRCSGINDLYSACCLARAWRWGSYSK